MARTKVGSYTGDGAAQSISLGFTPEYILVWNATDGDDKWEWYTGMTAAHALYTRAVTDNATTGNASMARITSNGITVYAGSSTAAPGFTIGTALSESGKTFRYVAIGGEDI